MKEKIKIAMAEDHLVMRQGIISLLRGVENVEVLYDVSNGQELLDKVKTSQPDVILLDIEMPVMDGGQALRHLTLMYPQIKVIMLSTYYNDDLIASFISMGAKAYLPKEAGIDRIIEAINSVYTNGYFDEAEKGIVSVSKVVSANSNEAKKGVKLTKRELEVLKLLQKNKTTLEIAQTLKISLRTVEGHRANLLRKTESKNLAALTTFAIEANLLLNI